MSTCGTFYSLQTRGSIIVKFMTIDAGIIIIIFILALGAILAARAGIRSIQSARKVVFYRTRRSYMLAGWQWLALAIVLFSSVVASALFGEPVANQLFPPSPTTTLTPTSTPLPTDTPLPTSTTDENKTIASAVSDHQTQIQLSLQCGGDLQSQVIHHIQKRRIGLGLIRDERPT